MGAVISRTQVGCEKRYSKHCDLLYVGKLVLSFKYKAMKTTYSENLPSKLKISLIKLDRVQRSQQIPNCLFL